MQSHHLKNALRQVYAMLNSEKNPQRRRQLSALKYKMESAQDEINDLVWEAKNEATMQSYDTDEDELEQIAKSIFHKITMEQDVQKKELWKEIHSEIRVILYGRMK